MYQFIHLGSLKRENLQCHVLFTDRHVIHYCFVPSKVRNIVFNNNNNNNNNNIIIIIIQYLYFVGSIRKCSPAHNNNTNKNYI